MVEEESGIWSEAVVAESVSKLRSGANARQLVTHAESSETGPSMQSPPISKYLKHPVLSTSRFSSGVLIVSMITRENGEKSIRN